jgi:HAMP domain-containing protein
MTSRSDPQQRRGLRASIGTKFALAVCLVLGIVSTWVGSELIDSSRKGLIDAKRRAAAMVVDAFAPTLVPALDFGDADAVAESARLLRAGKDVVAVAIWAGQEPNPAVAIPRPPPGRREPASDRDEMIGTSVVVTRRLVSPAGKEVGALCVEFTTLPEQEAARRTRNRIAATTALLALLVAGTVLGIARLEIVGPLRRLLLAMDAVASGQDATVPIRSRDEVGQLSSMFNQMSVAIRDRERRLQEALDRLQGLLDGMRQAIIVADSNGILPGLRSRQAEVMFGPERLQGDPAPLLFGDRPESVERIAFVQWLTLALGAASEEWESLRELAPTETVVRDAAGSRRELELEFRPILD